MCVGGVHLAECVWPKVAEWVEAAKTLGWYATRYLQAAYSFLPCNVIPFGVVVSPAGCSGGQILHGAV